MKKHRVLFDLALALHGYSGIPQDTRMMFLSLCQANQVDLTGLVSGMSPKVSVCALERDFSDPIKAAERFSYFIAALKQKSWPVTSKYRALHFIKHAKLKMQAAFNCFKQNYSLYPYHPQFLDFLWQTGFDGAVPGEYRDIVLKQSWMASNFSKFFVKTALLTHLPMPRLNTEGYDFAVFQDGTPVCPRVSQGTTPIVRYYDAVPLVYAHTIANPEMGPALHAAGIRSAQKRGAYFACDSLPAEAELLRIVPELEGKTFVVPVGVIANKEKVSEDRPLVERIILEHAASKALKFQGEIGSYIMSVSTLEPRKNFITLIRAFEKIRLTQDPNLKLLIVGSQGWQCEDILDAMRPHIEAGNLFHLHKVPDWALRILYAHARAFVFSSYYEGFGITPVEASIAGCPVIVSDIPVHRWVMGEGALYCDPYDLHSVSDVIEQLLYSEHAAALAEALKAKARVNAERFSLAAVAERWVEAFDKIAVL